MRVYTLLFALVLVLVVGTQANNKEQWREKKAKHSSMMKLKLKHKHHHRVGHGYYNMNKADDMKEGGVSLDDKMKLKKAYKLKKMGKMGMKLKHMVGKIAENKALKKTVKTMTWLNIKSEIDCKKECKYNEVCISGPVVNKPICVHKKDLKKSMKLFKRLHKKEMKDWKKFQKKHYKSDWAMNNAEEKDGRKNSNYSPETMKKLNLARNGNFHSDYKVKFHKKWQKHHKKHHVSHPQGKENVCGHKEMKQLKTRMMGWFHLLHGQDHAARKAHGGAIVKFYKHVSIKNELRELNGEKCQCMKSGMWQFHQMDKDHNDHLTDSEVAMLEENTMEPCVRPYLQSCDKDGDKKISSDEWCCCFTHNVPPCHKRVNEIRKSGKPVTYMPHCDKEGYFSHEQCKGATEDTRVCWCVDYNGNEFKDTFKNGRAHCGHIAKFGDKKTVPLV